MIIHTKSFDIILYEDEETVVFTFYRVGAELEDIDNAIGGFCVLKEDDGVYGITIDKKNVFSWNEIIKVKLCSENT